MSVRTRFAPSPTGYLHIGGVRTALFNWLFARKHGGQYILRIDDTDKDREVKESLQPILDGFRWLGLDWDEGPEVEGPHAPYFQSQRSEKYSQAVEALLASGAAYRDFSTADEYRQERETAEKAKTRFQYSRKWMAETDEQAAAFQAEGRSSVVRLKMPREGECVVNDLVRGEVKFSWIEEADHVIQRADGSCLYHLATVVDDADFEITHVLRSEEHFSNTPRQIFILEALGYQRPAYAHLPYVAEPGSKKKLSKRHIAKYLKNRDFKNLYESGEAIATRIGIEPNPDTFNPVLTDFYRDIGFLTDSLLNFLVLQGWALDDHTEEFSVEEMIEKFTIERVNKAPASFDPKKLVAVQQRYFDQLDIKKKTAMCVPFLQKAELVATPPKCDLAPRLAAIITAAGDRMTMAGDILKYDDFFVADDDLQFEEKAFNKRLVKPENAVELLKELRDDLAKLDSFDADSIEKLLKEDFIPRKEIQIGDIIHALRVGLSGKGVGFGVFEIAEILGKESSIARIDRAIAKAK